MPTTTMCKFPKMKSEDEFEEFVTEVLRRGLRARLHRYGRRGQAQHGVDAVGPLDAEPSKLVGVQCKNGAGLTIKDIEGEAALADGFQPPLAIYYVATSLDRDADLKRQVLLLDQQRISSGKFGVEIVFWQDLESELSGQWDVIAKYYPGFVLPDAADQRDREIKRRALSLIRGTNLAAKFAKSNSAIVTFECALDDDLDFEAAYSLMGDPRVVDANVDEARRVVGISVNRTSFPTALLLGDDNHGWPFGA